MKIQPSKSYRDMGEEALVEVCDAGEDGGSSGEDVDGLYVWLLFPDEEGTELCVYIMAGGRECRDSGY